MPYQRKRLSTGEAVGEPGPLPVNLHGLADDVLADLTALGLPDTGYFPVPAEVAPVRWLHKAIYLRRFTAAERIAIKAARAESQAPDDYLYLLGAAEDVFLGDSDLIAAPGLRNDDTTYGSKGRWRRCTLKPELLD